MTRTSKCLHRVVTIYTSRSDRSKNPNNSDTTAATIKTKPPPALTSERLHLIPYFHSKFNAEFTTHGNIKHKLGTYSSKNGSMCTTQETLTFPEFAELFLLVLGKRVCCGKVTPSQCSHIHKGTPRANRREKTENSTSGYRERCRRVPQQAVSVNVSFFKASSSLPVTLSPVAAPDTRKATTGLEILRS